MNLIENELITLKQDFSDHLEESKKAKIDKFIFLLKQMRKENYMHQEEDAQSRLALIRSEIELLKKNVKTSLKFNITSYDLFMEQQQKNNQFGFPDNFRKISFDSQQQKKPVVSEAILNLNFPILSTKVSDLCALASKIINYNFYCAENFNPELIEHLVLNIAENYNVLSYHNFSHAFSVFLMLYQCKNKSAELHNCYSSFEFFIAYISALCHDMNHKGTNSAFEIKKKTDLAIKYNNQSVLENMHISELHKMLRSDPKIDIFSSMDQKQKERGKKLMNNLIIATDVQLHGKKLGQLRDILEKQNQKSQQLSMKEKDIMLQNLFHACDIGNPCLGFDNYLDWAILLSYQFNYQSKLEEKEGLEISGMLVYRDLKTFYRSQIGFINLLAFPLWEQITIKWPELSFLKKNMEENSAQLRKRIEEQ